jgi:hypothetical protein
MLQVKPLLVHGGCLTERGAELSKFDHEADVRLLRTSVGVPQVVAAARRCRWRVEDGCAPSAENVFMPAC